MRASTRPGPLTLSLIARAWWPLAASWLLMATELPALSAVIARLPDAKINLAAYGGIVFPLALIVESPIIMLLSASTALSQDWASYKKIRRYMMTAGAILTALHVIVAFTPLYFLIARGILGAPEAIIGPARVGLMIMTPWTWSIAYRRFHQGVLIRFGHSSAVGVGTAVRLATDLLVLFAGLALGSVPGIVVATAAVSAGVVCEAAYVGIRVQPVLRNELANAPPVQPALTSRAFYTFYIPLVFTSLLGLLAQPIGSAALGRMPDALDSLATWPVMNGLVFMVRGVAIAFNEVVVTLLETPNSEGLLRRFTFVLAGSTTTILLLLAATPLSALWFSGVSALTPDLAMLARTALWLAIPMPALSALQSWYQGTLLHRRKTRGISESVAIFLVTIAAMLVGGVVTGVTTGLYVAVVALVVATFVQTIWLGLRAR